MELSFYLFIFITSQIMINKHNEQETDNYCLYIKIKKLFYGTSSDVIPNCVTYTCGACLGFSGLSKIEVTRMFSVYSLLNLFSDPPFLHQ